jgi:hypothetical protein
MNVSTGEPFWHLLPGPSSTREMPPAQGIAGHFPSSTLVCVLNGEKAFDSGVGAVGAVTLTSGSAACVCCAEAGSDAKTSATKAAMIRTTTTAPPEI